jgi:hypothetical protein
MRVPALLRFSLALALLIGLYRMDSAERPAILLMPPRTPARGLPDTRLEAHFAGQLTPDDLARGIAALLAKGQLRPEQHAQLAPAVNAGLAARREVDELRGERRKAAEIAATSALTLTETLLDLGWRPGGAP